MFGILNRKRFDDPITLRKLKVLVWVDKEHSNVHSMNPLLATWLPALSKE